MNNSSPASPKDFSRFQRIPEGGCELLSARYSQQHFGRHSHDLYAFGVITHGVEKLYYRGAHHLGTADAAAACGFCDQSHMARAFKKVVGVTPAAFRGGLAQCR